MVTDRNVGTLDRFAMHRVAGMPLTISEYDHPAPSSFCAEMYPLLNSMAAFQNWDGIYHFTFDGPWDEGYFRGFFSSSGHPLKQIFLPVGAAIFRMGAVKSGSQVVQMNLPRKAVLEQLVESGDRLRLHGSNMDQVWKKLGAPTALPMLRPMEVVVGGEVLGLNKSIEEPSGAWVSETGELTWDNRDSLQAVYTINAPAAKAAVGYIGGKKVVLGDVTIAMDTTEFNWASIALVTLDGEAISTSSKMLLVAAGRVENTNMGWNQERNSVSDQWGEAPTMAEGIPATIVFRNMDKLKVLALDPSGDPAQELKVSSSGGELSVKIGAQYKTLWYLLER